MLTDSTCYPGPLELPEHCLADECLNATKQIEEDLEFAIKLQSEECRSQERATVAGAAVLGAGVGLLAGGGFMAVVGAGLAALSASEVGRNHVGNAARATGQAAAEASRTLEEKTLHHRQRLQAAAARAKEAASKLKEKADTTARQVANQAVEQVRRTKEAMEI